ncbi:YihY family inner membrane protein [Helicobacter fennelliae]|uniref:Inner membrane protein YihY, formerly thought to be RNase BN n=2 Tax=Helicobacter fennelliae TaxID=215 RepID=T1D1E1_9HELI|nr:YihY family inner membrane protein [Helicobacter fennelliae]GAD19021.1 inner membrane protein YihY, formerly thought to be RNase BN [Helicobacter fennelliae MRY12-0050]SQB99304.1 ribonuclease BN [Helicobacter fennelliae]STP08487.1 ribonuclease BN [Helicobacter fennelliae]STQ84904.1 ribonuclease BN [Helicobacter fennelliae]
MALQYIKENGFINLCKAIKKKLLLTYRFLTYRQEMFYYAASLSFYTIFALIPMLFIIFSVLLAFSKFQDKIEDMQAFILSNILPTNAETMINFMHTFLENGSKMGIVGIISVFITSLLFFRNYEFITSKMFDSKPRAFVDSLMLYWTMVTLFPLGSAVIFYFSVSAQGMFGFFENNSYFLDTCVWFITCMLFLILFRISANKPLHKRTLFISSFVCGTIWVGIKNLFVYYIAYNKIYTTLYGSVSIVLFLMVWIYISWLVMLFGMRACQGILKCFKLENHSKI